MPDLQSSVDAHSIVRVHAAHQAIRGDETNALVKYYGFADTGSLETDPVWRILRVTFDGSANFQKLEWADGNNLYDNVWTNYLALTYS